MDKTEIYLVLVDAAYTRLKSRYVTGILDWADRNCKDLSDKEQRLRDTLERLIKVNASLKVFRIMLSQWENTINEIIIEWKNMIGKL